MSDVERLKEQLHQVALEAKQAAGGLTAFKLKFGQHSEQVQSLIAGTATGVDREIVQILDAASKAVEQAVQELEGGVGELPAICGSDLSSDLRRIAQGLVESLDEVPSIVAHLQQTATRLRQQASWIADLSGANPYGRMAALELDAAARACDEAAHRAAMAPPVARFWADSV